MISSMSLFYSSMDHCSLASVSSILCCICSLLMLLALMSKSYFCSRKTRQRQR